MTRKKHQHQEIKMSENIAQKRPIYFLVFAVVTLVLGSYLSYANLGLSLALIPPVISYIGIALLFIEIATGNIALVNISDWNKVEIGIYGKLALFFMAIGGVANSFVVG
ncbi:hypothetical protein [Simiduia aestuariiviva]|uniref:Uncharacterized protein n=1 Tax=Simiduia aestuariiviva TaxID=1510459 RepID=A0A839UTP2_9GAMM|nr:hypothetical protein [Simiduia aestuariiviva]MBB3168725.1 hypothetical protein [Simiduia aestuariiviva]